MKGAKDMRQTGMYNPHKKSMLGDPAKGMMMGSMDNMSTESSMSGMMGQGSDKKMKCPGMGSMSMPEKK
jgi:hypothetical protein